MAGRTFFDEMGGGAPRAPYRQIAEWLKRAPKELLAAKLALISMDSTLRSNLTVGPPLDLMIYRTDALKTELRRTIDEDDPYFQKIRQGWSTSLRNALASLPDVPW